jgi:uncharacterized protein (DUF2147 family)
MKLKYSSMIAALLMTATPALASEPIVGSWKMDDGTIIQYVSCNQTAFCSTVASGPDKGKSVGTMAGTGSAYTGKVISFKEGKTYDGKATASGNEMSLKGCALGGLICKSLKLSRQ